MTKIILGVVLAVLFAAAEQNEFKQGCDFYKVKQWKDAELSWKKSAEKGVISSELFCNIGTACFKDWQQNSNSKGQLAQAVLWWERSLVCDVQNEKALYNLKMVRSYLSDETPHNNAPARFQKALFFFYYHIPWNIQLWLAVFFLLLFSILASIMVLRRDLKSNWTSALTVIFIALWILFSASSFLRLNTQKQENYAVIISSPAVVYAEPIDSSAEAFTLHEGSKIYVLQTNDGWSEIRFGSGLKGWLKSESFVKITE